jgi:hypothetical protein
MLGAALQGHHGRPSSAANALDAVAGATKVTFWQIAIIASMSAAVLLWATRKQRAFVPLVSRSEAYLTLSKAECIREKR